MHLGGQAPFRFGKLVTGGPILCGFMYEQNPWGTIVIRH